MRPIYPKRAIRSHIDQERYYWEYDGPWGDGPPRWNYWWEGGEWVGVTSHDRYGSGYTTYFGPFHPLTGARGPK